MKPIVYYLCPWLASLTIWIFLQLVGLFSFSTNYDLLLNKIKVCMRLTLYMYPLISWIFLQLGGLFSKAPVWYPDKQCMACMQCHKEFNAIKRRHHCRGCGTVSSGEMIISVIYLNVEIYQNVTIDQNVTVIRMYQSIRM